MPKISVIVPIYNSEKYLKNCLDSLINEAGDYEFILINDGSKDNSEKIIKSYKDPRIKYYKNKNNGIGYTRNFGINKSTGENILFLDSDDYLEKDILKKLYRKQKDNNADIVIYNYKIIEKRKQTPIVVIKEDKLDDIKEIITNINFSPWNKMYNRKLLINNKILFPEKLKYEDVPFVIEALIKSKKITYLNEFGYNYVIHDRSETTIRDSRMFDILEILKKTKSILKSYPNEYKIILVKVLTNYTIQQRYNKNHEEAITFIKEAFKMLKSDVGNFKKNIYYKDISFIKKVVKRSKLLTIIYLKLYWFLKRNK